MISGIRHRRSFDELRSKGSWSRRGAVRCLGMPQEFSNPPEVAISIRRAVGGAVVRNRIRRQVRHAVTTCHRAGTLPNGLYLVSISSDRLPASGDELVRYLSALFSDFSA